jgi:hypothetical protein
MTYSIDVNGNDNTPEWGYCTYPDCKEEAEPIWLSGGFPDDPDLYLCNQHIGAKIAELMAQIEALQASAAFQIGSAVIRGSAR